MSNNRPTALFIELHFSGHRYRYLEWCSDAFNSLGYDIILGTLDNVNRDDKLQAWLAGDGRQAIYLNRSKTLTRLLGSIWVPLRNYCYVSLLYRRARRQAPHIELVFIPNFEIFSFFSPMLGSPFSNTRFAGIFLRPYFHLVKPAGWSARAKNSIKKHIFEQFMQGRHLHCAFTIDESLRATLPDRYRRKLVYLPDPAYLAPGKPATDSRAIYCGKRLVVLVYGSIDLRKGVLTLLQACAKSQIRENIHIIIAGIQTEALNQQLKDLRRHLNLNDSDLTEINRYIKDDEERDLFLQASIIWLGYEDFFTMSGVLAQAGLAKRPVITNEQGLIAYLVNRYSLGLAVDTADSTQLLEALERLVNDSDYRTLLGENGYRKFVHHTVAAFQDVLVQQFELL